MILSGTVLETMLSGIELETMLSGIVLETTMLVSGSDIESVQMMTG